MSAGCSDIAAVDGDVVVRTTTSAADSGCWSSTGCGDTAAVDGDVAARTFKSTADSGCLLSAGCSDIAAVDGDCSARTLISAADSGLIISAGCGDTAAVDGDCACILPASAADSGSILAGCGQCSHVFLDRLGINSKTVVLCHIDAAVGGQACTICQNQVNLAADGDAAADGHIAVDHIPAIAPCGCTAVHHSVVATFLCFPVLPVFITDSVRNRWQKRCVTLDCAASCDCSFVGDFSVVYNFSVIGEGHASVHSQGGVFRYGQRFARWNLYILLNGWISIDFTSISLEDNAAPTILLSLIADTPIDNNQGMTVRSGYKAAASTILSAADSGCIFSAIFSAACGDIAAVDGDLAARTHPSAADSGRTPSAGCRHCAAVDGDLAARTIISAADSGCRSSADCLHCAAVDGDSAARTGISAANSGC